MDTGAAFISMAVACWVSLAWADTVRGRVMLAVAGLASAGMAATIVLGRH